MDEDSDGGSAHRPGIVDVIGLDHVVLRCADVDATLRWYREVLGLAPVRVEEWRAGGVPFPSVRVDQGTIIDLVAAGPDEDVVDGRLDHVCLTVSPTDLAELARRDDLDVIQGPVPRFGARGTGTSLYVRDPDGAIVELRHYAQDAATP